MIFNIITHTGDFWSPRAQAHCVHHNAFEELGLVSWVLKMTGYQGQPFAEIQPDWEIVSKDEDSDLDGSYDFELDVTNPRFSAHF